MKVSSIPKVTGVEEVGEKVQWMGRTSFEAFRDFFDSSGYRIEYIKCRRRHTPVYPLRQNEEPVPIKVMVDGDAELMGYDYVFVLEEKKEEE